MFNLHFLFIFFCLICQISFVYISYLSVCVFCNLTSVSFTCKQFVFVTYTYILCMSVVFFVRSLTGECVFVLKYKSEQHFALETTIYNHICFFIVIICVQQCSFHSVFFFTNLYLNSLLVNGDFRSAPSSVQCVTQQMNYAQFSALFSQV